MGNQQATLREAMKRRDLTRDGFADRLGVSRRALDSWLLPSASGEHRRMPGVVAKLLAGLPGTAPQAEAAPGELRARFTKRGKPHLLSVAQFDRDAVEALLRVAEAMEPIARRRKVTRVLEGAVLGNLFFEPSTRTRVSFGAAFCRLGGSVCDTTGFTFSSMVKGESIADTSRVMSGYVDALVVRHPEQGSVAEFARHTHLPVINGGDGTGEHPTQALLDLYTIRNHSPMPPSDRTSRRAFLAFVAASPLFAAAGIERTTLARLFAGSRRDQSEALALVDQASQDAALISADDLYFLSTAGLYSVRRVIEQFGNPLRELSRNVRQNLSIDVASTTYSQIRSTYNAYEGIYALLLPTRDKFYVFDTLKPLEDGSLRVTTWGGNALKSLFTLDDNRTTYAGKLGKIFSYSGTSDAGASYRLTYESGWMALSPEVADRLKILKRIVALVEGTGEFPVVVKWGFDFRDTEFSAVRYTESNREGGEWNVLEWNIGEWGSGTNELSRLQVPGTGTGQFVKVAIEVDYLDMEFSLQQIQLFAKIERTA